MDPNDIGLVIDGRRVDAPATFDVTNPATGEVLAGAPDCSREQLDEAMAAAERAQREWRDDEPARRKALEDAANVLFANHEEIAPLLVAEQGKPLQSAKEEILGAGVWFKYYAGLELEPEVIQDDDKAYAEVVRRPMGVVAAITPWNFPVILASWKVAPALRAGNTVVLKPSPFTPLSTLKVAELLSEVLPPGVFNAVSGGDELGAWMTSHPTPRKVSFTGSVATGKKVAAAAAPDLKRVTLELGGNDPAIVLPDADVEQVAAKLFWGAFANSGQVCSAIKRVYAPPASPTTSPRRWPSRRARSGSATAWIPRASWVRSTTVPSSSGSGSWWTTPWPPAGVWWPGATPTGAPATSSPPRSSRACPTARAWSTRSSSAPPCR
jgi:acyl-CoA reductase-like NAD-dependent aldehyde dehydrogenase